MPHHCEECGAGFSSALAAEDCADQCRAEAYDRAHGNLFGINRSIN